MPLLQKIVVLIQIRYVASLKSQDVSRPLDLGSADCRDLPQLAATLGPIRDLADRGLGKPPHQASWPTRSQIRPEGAGPATRSRVLLVVVEAGQPGS